MDNFAIALNAVIPLFLLMALGYGLFFTGWADEIFWQKANTLCFKLFLPVLLFVNIYHTEGQAFVTLRLPLFAEVSLLVLVGVLCLIVPRLEPDRRKRGVIVQGLFRSNFVLMGVPIVTSLYPGAGSTVAMLIAIVVPTYNLLAVTVLEVLSASRRVKWTVILLDIIKNPLIIGSVSALLVVFLGLRLPRFLDKTLSDVASIATPLALIAMGASFRFSKVGANWRRLCVCIPGKLVVIPLIIVSLAAFLGFRGPELLALAVMFSGPVAVSSYQMALQANADGDLAAQIVVFSTAGSAVSLVGVIFILRTLGLI